MSDTHSGISLHPVLLRQLRRAGITIGGPEPPSASALQSLLEKVSECYHNAEEDRNFLERSIDLSSQEMEELNQRLETERNRLNTLLTTTEDCVCTLDRQGHLIWGNPAALRLLDLLSSDTISDSEAFVFWRHLEPLTDEECAATLQQGSRHRRALLRNRVGTCTPISYLLNEIAGAKENCESFVVVFRDITAEQMHEKELRNAREAAKAASRAKSELLANISHEVRTPLHGILGIVQVLLMEGGLNHNQTDYLHKLQSSADGLLRILNDILDLSKVEAGRLSVEKIAFRPGDLLTQVCALVEPQAQAKGLELRCQIEPHLAVSALGDPTRLRQILLNLASNAVKFTDHGFVELSLRWTAEENALTLHFQVLDSGIGIPPDQHQAIFDAFSQADSSITRRFGGTGLGLAICSRLARLMGGELRVKSELGCGSAFQFTIRLEIAPESQLKADGKSVELTLPPLQILYAEDNAINRLTGRKMLCSKGHSVDLVTDGCAAVEAVQKREYDVVLMDHQMPEMSGVEASREIRRLGQTTPIIAVSADAMREDRERFLAAGMDGFVGKPFTINDLEREIARVLLRRPVETTDSSCDGQPALCPAQL